MPLTLADELVLLGPNRRGAIESGIAGALLLELVLAGRLRAGDGRTILVADARPIGEPLADDALALIAASARPREARHWIARLAKGGARKRILAGLEERGGLATERGRLFGTRYVALEPGPERDVRRRVRAAALGEERAPDPRTVALAGLVYSTQLIDVLFVRDERKAAKKRIDELAAADATMMAVLTAVVVAAGARAAG